MWEIEESPSRKLQALRETRDLWGIAETTLEQLAAHARRLRYTPNEMIELAGSDPRGVYIVVSGCTRLSSFGRAVTLGSHTFWYICRGELLRFLPPDTTLEAADRRTDVYRIREAQFAAVESVCPELGRRVRDLLQKRIDELCLLNGHRGRRDVDAALIFWLLRLASTTDGRHVNRGCSDLAGLAGTTRQTVSERLTAFARHGWIEWQPSHARQQHIGIMNAEALCESAGIQNPADVRT